MSYVKGLKCRECGRPYPKKAIYVCEYCFGPLEVDYDYTGIKKILTRKIISSRPKSIWRYRELLPIDGEPVVGINSGFTPLIKSKNLGKELGARELYIKDDSVCHPTLSFKDRVVSVALTRAVEFGFDTVACASTGNLANSVSALGAVAGLRRFVFIPADLEIGKVIGSLIYSPRVVAVEGNYDEVNRLCAEVAGKYKWAFVNINIRPYYAEGSKTYGFEIAEQLGWRAPRHIVVPVASGSLLCKIYKGLKEFKKIGLIEKVNTRLYAAQAKGCAPIAAAIKEGSEIIKPVKPNTIAKSLAIGNPADGYYAFKAVTDTGGWAEEVTDEEIIEAMKLLAQTEGIFTETAGGVTVAVTKKLIESGRIPREESIVICITGNGLKTQEAVTGKVGKPIRIKPNLSSFEAAVKL
ncbi:threonine synthase [Candidatus Desantisbacteria bacterium CG_4_10_14_0_8_um_filter_48_22]|uniref:Threonine synthase n=1 Tax=Candidatus Desantisbacteria bacterium CG_4_10_14_0_8_um_filter_48_22 TaxID=1974543 RepID=A0A2M7SAK7_9BACT|nr:MAG: threonine synthase [Candidatus Desantisbacteria bacterium CG02_land_8_20_14_3_00_49_13]PIZ16554.1 MAG: threonine synthase [Candidatus Desantisbacteria bacterium CG_4_10_14_0_8_um_filter_48_22]